MTIREDYGIPEKDAAPIPLRIVGLVGLLLLLSLVGCLVSGGGVLFVDPALPVYVFLFVVALGVCGLALVFLGVAHILGSRKLTQAPGRDLRPPNS